jgi:hypothetical protein
MCFFRKKLPHPEQSIDYDLYIEPQELIQKWRIEYAEWGSFWNDLDIQISDYYEYPGLAFSDKKQIWIRPEWANTGVLAHEIAHISYYHLDDLLKQLFIQNFEYERRNDKLLKFAYKEKPYMQTSYVEAHADVYRYLGRKMPESLKAYYPYLM